MKVARLSAMKEHAAGDCYAHDRNANQNEENPQSAHLFVLSRATNDFEHHPRRPVPGARRDNRLARDASTLAPFGLEILNIGRRLGCAVRWRDADRAHQEGDENDHYFRPNSQSHARRTADATPTIAAKLNAARA